jgi:hypothetical protein
MRSGKRIGTDRTGARPLYRSRPASQGAACIARDGGGAVFEIRLPAVDVTALAD